MAVRDPATYPVITADEADTIIRTKGWPSSFRKVWLLPRDFDMIRYGFLHIPRYSRRTLWVGGQRIMCARSKYMADRVRFAVTPGL